jgi:hypothetical protein
MNQNLAQRDEALRRKDDKIRDVRKLFSLPTSSSMLIFLFTISYNSKFPYYSNN